MKKVCFSFVILLLCAVSLFAEQLVEISIEITEINNNKAKEYGIKWVDEISTGELFVTNGEGNTTYPSLVEFNDWVRYTPLSAKLKLLQESGSAQVLSNPKLLTKSGTKAKFLVGGEFPIAVSGVSGGNVEWKEYGIITEILPKILSDDKIDLVIETELSRLDWANAVQGLPNIAKRQARSSVILKNQQTIVIAGLIENYKDKTTSGIPLLSDIPLLGTLFKNTKVKDNKTNVLIFVTPKIIEQ
ncbi:MAG: type II and III secretion system protein [Elusimicrobia bacterium]|jgi:pilus assembly protein CpaC|nr:type II and III secretion system protein [Elusimicrobiota bacterium]